MLNLQADGSLRVAESNLCHANCTSHNGLDPKRGVSEVLLRESGILDVTMASLPAGGGGVRAQTVKAMCEVQGVVCSERTAHRAVANALGVDASSSGWNDYRYCRAFLCVL